MYSCCCMCIRYYHPKKLAKKYFEDYYWGEGHNEGEAKSIA